VLLIIRFLTTEPDFFGFENKQVHRGHGAYLRGGSVSSGRWSQFQDSCDSYDSWFLLTVRFKVRFVVHFAVPNLLAFSLGAVSDRAAAFYTYPW
jgi:hypothetical protein